MVDNRALYQICAIIFPAMVCSGIVYTILPLYISEELGASPSQIGMIYMVGAACGALLSPYLGKISDRMGRRLVLAFSLIGFALAFASYALLQRFHQAFFVQAVEGASWAAMGAVVPALIADTTPEDRRGWAMGMYSRTWSLSWVLGPLVGGFLAELIGYRLTFIIGGVISGLGILGLRSKLLKSAP